MSGIFRAPFRVPVPVQPPFGALSAAAVAGLVRPPILGNTAQVFGPSVARATKPAALPSSVLFHTVSVRCTLRPVAFVGGNAFPVTTVSGASSAIALPLFSNTATFQAVGTRRTVRPPTSTEANTYFSARLVLRISAAIYANSQVLPATAVGPAGVKGAPFLPSQAQLLAPHVSRREAIGTTAGAIGVWSGSQHRSRAVAPKRAKPWPNLPKVAYTGEWRLTVVTPDIARIRARALATARRRAGQAKCTRAADKRVAAILDDLVDQEVAATVARLLKEEA